MVVGKFDSKCTRTVHLLQRSKNGHYKSPRLVPFSVRAVVLRLPPLSSLYLQVHGIIVETSVPAFHVYGGGLSPSAFHRTENVPRPPKNSPWGSKR